MVETKSIWGDTSPADFSVDGFPRVIFPVWERLDSEEGLRLVARKVPWVPGEQLDHTGTKATVWNVEIPFCNDIAEHEPGIGETPQLYPDRLELLLKVFRAGKTGTLNLPWSKNIRCKAETWRRSAGVDRQDMETLSVVFHADNEAKLTGQSAQGISAAVNLRLQADNFQFEAERSGMWDGSIEDITEFASQLETALQAPGEFKADILHKANRVKKACDRILSAFDTAVGSRGGLRDPEGAHAHRALFNLRMSAERSEAEARAGLPVIQARKYDYPTSIWEIAVMLKQDADKLIALNPGIEDPNWIPKRTPVLTYR